MDSGKVTYAIENTFGSTTIDGNMMAQAEGCLIYVAGSLVIFYSPKLDEQIGFLKHNGGSISAIAVSNDEKLLAVADRSKQSSISIYSIENLQQLDGSPPKAISVLRAHKHMVDILTFSGNSKYLLSISNHDGSMFLWEKGENITKNRVSKAVTRAVFDGNGDLVTIGRGFLKLWKFNDGEVMRKKEEDCWILEGKVLTFGKTFSSKQFIEIVFYKPSNPNNSEKVLLLSSDGMLCIMAGKYEKVEKWIDLIITHASGLKVVDNLALCGGDNAVIKAVDLSTLTLKLKFPKPPPTTKENLTEQQQLQYGEDEQFPPCIAILKVSQYIVTLYSNRTMFVWELREQPVAFRSILSHRGGISSLSLLQEIKGDICFIASCSEDGTVRLWHFYKKQFEGQRRSIDIAREIGLKRNVYCRNLTHIIYSHSQFPIIRTKLFLNNTLACISSQQFLLYSLDNFQLLLLHSFDEEQGKVPARIKCLQTNGQMVLIGDEAGKLKVFKVIGESIIKVKEWELQMPIEGLQVFMGRILAWGKGRMKCMSIEGDVLLNAYNVQCGWGWNNSIVYCEKRSLMIYSLNRGKRSGSLTLSHELDELQSVRSVKASSWLIAIITTKNRLLVANYSAVILYSEQLCEAVTDLIVSQGGEIIISLQGGTIQIRRQKQGKFVRIDEKVKRWFEMNDMSWMDGSVWASSKHRSYSNSNPVELEGVEHQNSIRLGEAQGSVKSPLKKDQDVVISYRNQENKRSIFDPTSIYAQINKVNSNMNEIMKQKAPLISEKSKSKRRIFQKQLDLSQKSQYAPAFTSNLIQSVMRDAPPSLLRNDKEAMTTEDNDKVVKSAANSSLHISFVELQQPQTGSPETQFNYTQSRSRMEGSTEANKGEFMKAVAVMMEEYENLRNSREDVHAMVLENYGQFEKLYKLLSLEFGKEQREQWKAKVSEKFNKYSSAFLADFNDE